MPTPEVTGSAASHSEEIKYIAREYAEYHGSIGTGIAEDMLNWLCKTHCIVEKSKIIEKYNEVKTWRFSEYFRGRFQVLKELFGTELFNEKKEVDNA